MIKRKTIPLSIFLILYLFGIIFIASFITARITSSSGYEWNSMNIYAEYYIVFIQPLTFALFYMTVTRYKAVIFARCILSVIFICNFLYLFKTPFFSSYLLKPMHATGSNACETGNSFAKNKKMFLELKQKMPEEFLDDYIKRRAE